MKKLNAKRNKERNTLQESLSAVEYKSENEKLHWENIKKYAVHK